MTVDITLFFMCPCSPTGRGNRFRTGRLCVRITPGAPFLLKHSHCSVGDLISRLPVKEDDAGLNPARTANKCFDVMSEISAVW